MKTRVIASTKVGYELPIKEAITFSGQEAGICCMQDTIDTILVEPEEKSMKRANDSMTSNNHSIFGHPEYNFVFEEIPKILAMVLNNEKVYETSENSEKYTEMQLSKEETELCKKWNIIFKKMINILYPQIEENLSLSLAKENTQYLISVFTPTTVMGHSISLQQFSYILHFMEDFVQKEKDTNLNKLLKPYFKEFVESHTKFKIEGINPDSKNKKLSLFSDIERKEEWGENYCCSYWTSLAQLAQIQKHKALNYEIVTSYIDAEKYYVPTIIAGTNLEEEWIKDISSLSKRIPQGKMFFVNERGTVEDFVLKCKECLCGTTQLEIAMQTRATLEKYLRNTKKTNERVYNYLMQYESGARCTFPDYQCAKPCVWGPENALHRLV